MGSATIQQHADNYSAPLPGQVQTNQRSELAAVIYVLQSEARDVHVKSDSAYVVNGCCKHRFSWSALGWRKVKNLDLWQELHGLLQSRPGAVLVTKVKGHASERDVRTGRVLKQDKVGNDAADCLASACANSHALCPQRVRDYKLRRAVTQDVQTMMVDIIEARAPLAKLVSWNEAAPESPAQAAAGPTAAPQPPSLTPPVVVEVWSGSERASGQDRYRSESSESEVSFGAISISSGSLCLSSDLRLSGLPEHECPEASLLRVPFEAGLRGHFVSGYRARRVTQFAFFSGINHPT